MSRFKLTRIRNVTTLNRMIAIAVSTVVLGLGYVIFDAFAANSNASIEAESSKLSMMVNPISDTGASGGEAIQFGASSTEPNDWSLTKQWYLDNTGLSDQNVPFTQIGSKWWTKPEFASNLIMTDQNYIQGAKVNFENIEVNAGKIRVMNSVNSEAVVENCIAGNTGVPIWAHTITIRNCNVTASTDGMNVSQSAGSTLIDPALKPRTLIEYNYIWRDGTRVGATHHDGLQWWSGGKATVRRNYIEGWVNSCIIIKPDHGFIDDILIEENYFSNNTDGFYHIYVRTAGSYGRPTNITIKNNVFARDATPISSGATPSDQTKFVRTEAERLDPTWIVWAGNTWADDGSEVVPPGGWVN